MRETRADTTIAVLLAIALHLLIVLFVLFGMWWSSRRQAEPAAGPIIEADLIDPSALSASTRRALSRLPEPVAQSEPPPQPAPIAEEETVPPPQPLPESRPQDAVVPQQQQAQEHIPVPDRTDQERVSAQALAQEQARQKEQEARQRQEQIDLTERQRQEEAESRQRLAQQQTEADKQKKLDQIRREREQATRDANLAEQKLRQLANAKARESGATTASAASPPPGQGGSNNDLRARYAQAIEQAVRNQWVRPDSVPLGQKCTVMIVQIVGGDVAEAKVAPGCPFDEAGKRSLEAAVLRAQPLPYRGFESVFSRELTINFTAQDR